MKDDDRSRASRGAIVLRDYVENFDHGLDLNNSEDYLAATADLIADLLHAGGEVDGFSYEDALAAGRMYFEAEKDEL